jgi:hypothetical protein
LCLLLLLDEAELNSDSCRKPHRINAIYRFNQGDPVAESLEPLSGHSPLVKEGVGRFVAFRGVRTVPSSQRLTGMLWLREVSPERIAGDVEVRVDGTLKGLNPDDDYGPARFRFQFDVPR